MSGSREQSLYFISLPDQRKLCSVLLSFQVSPEDCRNQQIKTCRDLVLVYSDILASPALNSFTDIWLIMAMPFYQKGIIQAYGRRHNLQLGTPQCVLPGILQCCVSYSLTTRLAPRWNRAGPYLLSGKDFLAESGRLNAIRMELNASANQLCVSVEANTVRLPPTKLEDFDFPPVVLKSFSSQMDCVLHTSTGACSWCYVLPSMKRGRIISISHHLPTDSPFKTYQDLQKHWQSLYGYSLPEQTTEEQIYCSVYFKPVGERLFTYPLSCIRLQPMHCCPRVNLQGALNSFISDLRDRLQSICGLPVPMTSKPCYHTSSLTSSGSAQVLDGEPVNLSTRSSIRPVLAQPPAPAAPPVRPPSGLQPPGRPPASLRPSAGGVSRGERREDVRTAEQRRGAGLCGASGTQTQSSFGERAGSSPASAAAASCPPSARPSPFSSLPAAAARLPGPPAPADPRLKLVPIFRNRSLPRHVNVTRLLARKQQGQGRGGPEEGGRVTLAHPASTRAAPAASSSPSPSDPRLASRSSSPSSSSSSLPSSLFVWSQRPCDPILPPSRLLPRFTPRSESEEVDALQGSRDRHRPGMTLGAGQRGVVASGRETQPLSSILKPAAPAVPLDVPSNKGGERFESKPKRRRPTPTLQEVDVEGMARNNQLSKVNSATLLAWLRGRGVAVRVKDKKEELMLRVMGCLAEA